MNLVSRIGQRYGRLSGRSKAVGAFFATSLAARLAGSAAQLLQVPIAVKALGPEAFGLWMTLVGLGCVITFADFGVGQGAQNQLAEAFAAGQEARARELWGTVAVLLLSIGLVLAVSVALLAPRIDFAAIFNLVDPAVRRQAGTAVTVTLLLFCLNFPLGLAQRLAYSRQQGWTHNIAQAFGALGALAGVLLAAYRHWPLAGFIAAAQAPLILANAGLLAWQLGQLGWLDLRLLRCRQTTLRPLLKLGVCFGIQQAHLTLLLSLPPVLISTRLGAAAVTPYNLAQRLFNLFAIVQNAFMLPLWPAYSDAKARGDLGWIRRTLFFSLGATVTCTIAPMFLGAWWARPLIAHWVGSKGVLPSASLVWLLFLWNAMVFIEQPFGYFLAGISEVRKLTFYAIISALASAGLMAELVRRNGREGVVLGLIIGYLPYLILGNVCETVRFLRDALGRRIQRSPLIRPQIAGSNP